MNVVSSDVGGEEFILMIGRRTRDKVYFARCVCEK